MRRPDSDTVTDGHRCGYSVDHLFAEVQLQGLNSYGQRGDAYLDLRTVRSYGRAMRDVRRPVRGGLSSGRAAGPSHASVLLLGRRASLKLKARVVAGPGRPGATGAAGRGVGDMSAERVICSVDRLPI